MEHHGTCSESSSIKGLSQTDGYTPKGLVSRWKATHVFPLVFNHSSPNTFHDWFPSETEDISMLSILTVLKPQSGVLQRMIVILDNLWDASISATGEIWYLISQGKGQEITIINRTKVKSTNHSQFHHSLWLVLKHSRFTIVDFPP